MLYWVLLLSHDLDVDLANALRQKLAANELKYPVSLSRGKSSKYKDLAPETLLGKTVVLRVELPFHARRTVADLCA